MKTYKMIALLWMIALPGLTQPIVVVYDLHMEGFYHPVTSNRVYNLINSSIQKCGGMTPRHNHEWKKGVYGPTDAMVLEQEVRLILMDILFQGHTGSKEDLKKLEAFSKSITTDVIVLPVLVRLGYDLEKEYELTIHMLDVKTLQYLKGPKPISFSRAELDNADTIEEKICSWLEDDKGTGLRDSVEEDEIQDLESLRRWERMLIRMDRMDGGDGSSGDLVQLRQTPKGKLLFLNEKAVVISQEIEFEFELEHPSLGRTIRLFEEMIDTLQQMHELEKSKEGKRVILEKIKDYSFQLKEIKKLKP